MYNHTCLPRTVLSGRREISRSTQAALCQQARAYRGHWHHSCTTTSSSSISLQFAFIHTYYTYTRNIAFNARVSRCLSLSLFLSLKVFFYRGRAGTRDGLVRACARRRSRRRSRGENKRKRGTRARACTHRHTLTHARQKSSSFPIA